MDAWKSVQVKCKKVFGYEPSVFQMRLWWFGTNQSNMSEERKAHREQVERNIAPWDVIVKNALNYTVIQVSKSKSRWSDADINKFVYFLLWDKYRLFDEVKTTKGTAQLPTFWQYCMDHKNAEQAVLSKRGVKSIKQALKMMIEGM